MHLRSVLAELHRLDHRLRLPGRAPHDGVPHEEDGADGCACGVAVKSRHAHACNEEAFRYFFALERQRARRSGRALLLLLVELKELPRAHLEPRLVPKLFWGLSRCLRETDIMGWYRERRVAGALLTGLREEPGPEMAGLFVQRTTRILSEVLPAHTARLQVRLYQHRELVAGDK